MHRLLFIFVGIIIIATSFTSDAEWKSRRKKRYDCTRDLTRAIARYEKGRYNEAKTILGETKYQCTGHSSMDSILYYLGMSALRAKTPEEARTEFDRLVIDFPNSPFAEEAHFRIGHGSYLSSNPPERDQSKTKDAIRELSGFIDDYPGSVFADSARVYIAKCENKLARKEYETARFYQKLEKYEAAIVYYRALTDDYPESEFVAESRLSIAYCLAKIQRTSEARQVLEQLLEKGPGEEIAKKARSTMERLEQLAQEKSRCRLFKKLRQAPDSPTTPPAEDSGQKTDVEKSNAVPPSGQGTVTPESEHTPDVNPGNTETYETNQSDTTVSPDNNTAPVPEEKTGESGLQGGE
jgi:outer membrane protein assembly factor BamD